MRGVTLIQLLPLVRLAFQLTRLMRGVTHTIADYINSGEISTHTPHARRDTH